uniref:Uncharacterized protein n=1 Tax=Oryza meridionalis TaxID=40149 RepID=A0A0E0CDB8_9ORYZ
METSRFEEIWPPLSPPPPPPQPPPIKSRSPLPSSTSKGKGRKMTDLGFRWPSPPKHRWEEIKCSGRSQREHVTPPLDADSHISPPLDVHQGVTAQVYREPAAKHRANYKDVLESSGVMPNKYHRSSSGEMPSMRSTGWVQQKHHATMTPGRGMPMPQKHQATMGPGFSSSGGMPQINRKKEKKMVRSQSLHCPSDIQVARIINKQAPGEEKTSEFSQCTNQQPKTSSGCSSSVHRVSTVDYQDSKESPANKIAQVTEVNRRVQEEEAERIIQEMNELGLGESITGEEYLYYLGKLPHGPPRPDTKTELCDAQLDDLNIRHALYRLKYYKEDDHKLRFLQKHRYFKHFEEDGILDWSFRHEYCLLASLNDYQRLVPEDTGFWLLSCDKYHHYFYSHEVDLEYLKYIEELSKKLKDFVKKMNFEVHMIKEFDGIFFEIWQRISLKKSFRDAFEEVSKLDKFPIRQDTMKKALENGDESFLEEKFYDCIKGITGEVTDNRAQELIAEAVSKLWRRPRGYEDYARRKIDIARAIGLIP